MADRKRNESQDRVLAAIREALAEEKGVLAAAKVEADELIRRRTQEARNKTNALMHAATTTHGITKKAVALEGLGNTNRNAVDLRLQEHIIRYVQGSEPVVIEDEPAVAAQGENTALTVERREDGVTIVNLDQFSHEDVGDDLSGEIIFEPDGTVRTYDAEMAPTVEANPLFPMRLWGLEEVQNVR